MDRRIVGIVLACMLGLTPAYAANICDPANGTACDKVNSSATGGGAHTSDYSLGANNYGQAVFTGQKATYAATSGTLTTFPSTTDVFIVLCGSNTKAIYLQKFNINGSESNAAARRNFIIRQTIRPTAITVGTAPTTLTATPFDSAYGAATADVVIMLTTATTSFTRTPDTSVIVGTQTRVVNLTGTPTVAEFDNENEWDFTGAGERSGMVLRGSTQCIEVALTQIGANAPTWAFLIQWAEVQEN